MTIWAQNFQDNFIRANSATVGNNWTALTGGLFSIAGDVLSASIPNIAPGFTTNVLYRQASEAAQNTRIVNTIPNMNALGAVGNILRYQTASANQYLFDAFIGSPSVSDSAHIYKIVSGSPTLLGLAQTVVFDATHSYSFDCSAVGINPTTLTYIIADQTTGLQVLNYSITDSETSLQNATGVPALSSYPGSSAGYVQTFNGIATYVSGNGFTAAASSPQISTTGNTVTLTGVGTTWTTGTTFTLSGVSGCSIASKTYNSATSYTLTLSTGAEPGIAIISDGTYTANVTVCPITTTSMFSDNFHRSNSSAGGVWNQWYDVVNGWEILSNQAVATTSPSDFTGKMLRPLGEHITNGVIRAHYGPGYGSVTTQAFMVYGRVQDVTSESQCVGAYLFPGATSTLNFQIFTISAASITPTAIITSSSGITVPEEGWFELIMAGTTITANIYHADGVTLVDTLVGTVAAPFLTGGTSGIGGFTSASSPASYLSEFDSYLGASISLSPVTYVGSGTVAITVTGQNTAFSGSSFSVSGTPTAVISSQSASSATSATVNVNVGSYIGLVFLTDSISGATASFQVYHSPNGILNIGYIGDSITQGTNGDPVGDMATGLEILGYQVTQVNRGVSGSSTGDWVNGTGGTNLTASIAAMVAAGCTYCQIMLGTNDTRNPNNFTPAVHFGYMQTIVAAVVAAGIKVLLNAPLWSLPGVSLAGGTANWPVNVNTLYQQYHALDLTLVDNVHVFAGDTQALNWFENNPSHLQDGIHPTAGGNVELGQQIWVNSFLVGFKLTGQGSGGGGYVFA